MSSFLPSFNPKVFHVKFLTSKVYLVLVVLRLCAEGSSKAGLKLALLDARTGLVKDVWRIIDEGDLWLVLRVCVCLILFGSHMPSLRLYALLENVGNILGKDMVPLFDHIMQDCCWLTKTFHGVLCGFVR